MSDPEERAAEAPATKLFRIDLVIALCALLVSSLATAASVWQSRVVAQQLASQIWPYVAFQTSYHKDSVTLTISNEGLGPARVRWIRVLIDGKPQHTFRQAMRTLGLSDKVKMDATFSDLSPGHVIRVGGSTDLFRINTPAVVALILKNYKRTRVEGCYCPIIDGNCWITVSGGPGQGSSDPQTVAACPDYTDQMFTSGFQP